MNRLLVGTVAAGAALHLTARQVRRLVADGTLINHGTDRRILLHVREVDEYDATRRISRRARSLTQCPLRSA